MPGGTISLYPVNAAPIPYTLLSIEYELLHNGVAVCKWDNHKTRNALTRNMVMETMAVIEHMKRDDKVRVAVWGGRTNWGSGLDLKRNQFVGIPQSIIDDYTSRGIFPPTEGDNVLRGLTLSFWEFPKISIAAVEGFAVGGACNMALAGQHDLVIASDTSRFVYPFMKLGITPELGSSTILPSIIGLPRAKELLLLGEWFDAKEAHRMGLVNRLTANPWESAITIAGQLSASEKQHTLRACKKLLNAYPRAQLNETFPREMVTMSEMSAQKWAFAKL